MKTLKAPTSTQKLLNWVRGKSPYLNLKVEGEQDSAVLLKLPTDRGIDYIFMQYMEGGWLLGHNGFFYCCGIYVREQDRLCCCNHLSELVKDLPEESAKSKGMLLKEFNQTVNDRVAAIVTTDREKYGAKKITTLDLLKELTRYGDREVKRDAATLLFADKKPEDIHYIGTFERFAWGDKLVGYLLDREGHINATVEDFIANGRELILLGFLKADALRAKYTSLLANKDDPIHTIKAVSDAASLSGARHYVDVTVRKGGAELTFIEESGKLMGYHESYDTKALPPLDRERFAKLFGANANYTAQDIVRIARGTKTIYEAPKGGE